MLTDRETQAARLIAAGNSRQALASELSVTLSAIDKLLRSLKTKLGAKTQVELALACNRFFAADPSWAETPRYGPFYKDPSEILPDKTPVFSQDMTFRQLFDTLHTCLAPFQVTCVGLSHIRRTSDGGLDHFATRWTVDDNVTYDTTIPPEENLSFKHAISCWDPLALDLEEMMKSDLYDFVPPKIRAQNDVFVNAGLVRGIIFSLPGVAHDDRLVAATLMGGISAPAFTRIVANQVHEIHEILIRFRNAHVGLAAPAISLRPSEGRLMTLLAKGMKLDQAATEMGVSHRAAQRLLAQVRLAFDCPTTLSAMAAFRDNQNHPVLPL